MKIAVCDDDKMDIVRLKKLIHAYDSDNNIGFSVSEYGSGSELLNAVKNGEDADIIFLDINMDDMDGLSVAKKIREHMDDVPIVLVTAFMNYALDGYKVRASRFLIKDDLDKTFNECMDDICSEIRKKSKFITFSCVEGEIRLKASDIILIETFGHKNMIKISNQTYQIYEKLNVLEEQLRGYGFLRTHNSFLVNMMHIRGINSYVLTLDNGRQLPVPKARYKQVRQEYALFVGKEL
ncbi:LytR/AlgR family response regulator transcription factor [Butyrivibrio fibrisolvens]|uniref:LytR/AlgR family response regulator transcription factor n=1 Tax=Butyrivibrio fibrisolvens TaxID=831 RepID=UPI0003B50277|nr:LytTR family DNA-binding domain-containing protein [Butyrivibrio fibrisolvens]